MPQQTSGNQSPRTPARENVDRMRRFAGTATDKSKGTSVLSRISAFAREENERKRKADEEAARKKRSAPAQKPTEPQKGFFSRMYDKYVSGKKEGS